MWKFRSPRWGDDYIRDANHIIQAHTCSTHMCSCTFCPSPGLVDQGVGIRPRGVNPLAQLDSSVFPSKELGYWDIGHMKSASTGLWK